MLRKCIFLLGFVGFTITGYSQIQSMSFVELEKKIASTSDRTLVVNFWATWCRPCVEELPYFEKVHAEFASKGVEVWLINLDFNSAVESTVIPFIKKRDIRSRVIHITDTDPNEWINKIDKSWGGNIPVTAIYKNGQKLSFHPNQLSYEELVSLISK